MFFSMMIGWYVASSLWYTVQLKKDYDKGNTNELVYQRSDYFILAANVLMICSQIMGHSFLTSMLYFLPLNIFMAYALEKSDMPLSGWDIILFIMGLYPLKSMLETLFSTLEALIQPRLPSVMTLIRRIADFLIQGVRPAFNTVSCVLDQLLSQELVSLMSEQFYNVVFLGAVGLIFHALIVSHSMYACVSMVAFLVLYSARLVGFGSGKLNTGIDVLLRLGQVALFFSGISVSFMGVGQALTSIIAVTGSRLTAYFSEPLAYLFSNIKKLGHLHRISQTAFVRPVKLKILKSDSQFWKEDIVKKFLGIDEQGLMEKSKVRVGQYLQEHESNQDINTVLRKLNEQILGITDDARREQYLEISVKISDQCGSLDGSQQKHFAYILAKYVDWLKDNPQALDDLFKDVGVCASGLLTNIENMVGAFSGNMMQSYVFWRQCKSTEITCDDIKGVADRRDIFLTNYLQEIVKQNSTQLLGRGTNTNYEVHSTNFKKALFDPSAAKSLIASDGTLSMLLDSLPGFMIWNYASLFYSQPIESLLAKSIYDPPRDDKTARACPKGAFYNHGSLRSENTWNELDKRLVEIMKRNDSTFSLDKLKTLQWELLEPHINTEHDEYDTIKQWFKRSNLIRAFDAAVLSRALREPGDVQKIYRQVLLPFVLLDWMDSGIMLRLGDHGGALSGPQEIASTKFNWIKTCSYGAWLWLRIPLWIAKDVVRYALSMIWELSVSVAQTVTGQKKTNLSFMGAFKNLIHHAALYAGMSVLMVNDLFFGTLYCSGMMLKMAAQCLFVTVFFGLKLPVKMMEGFYQVNYDLVLGLSQMVRSVVFSNDAQSESINQSGIDTAKTRCSSAPGKGV